MELTGHQLHQSKKLKSLFAEIVVEYVQLSKSIVGPKEPDPALEKKSKELLDRIGKVRGRPLYYPYVGTGIGRGPYVELEDGSVKLDLINGIGIHLFGHGHPKVIEATLRGAVNDIVMQGHLQANNEYLLMSEKLIALASRKTRLRHAWLTTCGTMAIENALKIARQKNSPARMMLCMTDSFSGRSTMMAEMTDNPEYKVGLPEYNEVLRVPFYDYRDPQSSEKSLRILKDHVARHEKNISTFMFEPMLGEGGYRVAPREYFLPMLEFCKSKNIAIWTDEIQTFTRTGNVFASETLGFAEYVDICTIAKTAQIGATLYTEEYNPKPGLIAGTFASATTALEAGTEILRMLDEENYLGPEGKIQKIHKYFVSGVKKLNETTCKGLAQEAGGLGLMIAFTPLDGSKDKVAQFQKTLFKNGLMSYGCGRNPYRIRFLVPAVMTEHDTDVAMKIIEKSLLECA
jgi:4-aminobutyrate aminotransferase-like enzyme